MKKLSLLFTLFLSVTFVYSQEKFTTVSGEKRVCPGREYVYRFKLASPLTVGQIPFVEVLNGVLVSTKPETMPKGSDTLRLVVKWNDIGYRSLKKITITAGAAIGGIQVTTSSYGGTSAAHYSNYLFSSSPYQSKDNVIKIPYAQTGTLHMRTAGALQLDPNDVTGYTTNKYVWDIPGQGKIETINEYNLQYGLADLDGVTVKVYPFNELCDKKIYGDPYSVKIERYLDAKITTTEKESCKNTNVTYKLEGAPSGSTIEWVPGDNVTIVSGQGSSSAIFKTSSDGALTVNAVVTYMGKNITISNSDVWVGTPNTPTGLNGFSKTFNSNSRYIFNVDPLVVGATSYKWEVSGGKIVGPILGATDGSGITVETDAAIGTKPKYLDVKVYAVNKCGTSTFLYKTGTIKPADGGSVITRASILSDSEFTPQSIKVYNLSGTIVHSQDNISGDFDIKSTTLPDGIYIIEKSDGKERQSEKIILKR